MTTAPSGVHSDGLYMEGLSIKRLVVFCSFPPDNTLLN